jgi:hypothetical protein
MEVDNSLLLLNLCGFPWETQKQTRGAFPSDKSLMRLAGCILININEEWVTGKKYLSMDDE